MRSTVVRVVSMIGLVLGCADTTSPGASPALVRIQPASLALETGFTDTLHAVVLDGHGDTVATVGLTWEVSDPGVASIAPDGAVTALQPGATQVRVVAGSLRDSIPLTVTLAAVATVELTAPDTVLAEGDSIALLAVPRDRAGRALSRTVAWSTTDPSKASVDSAGKVKGLDFGSVTVLAKSGSAIASVPLRVYLAFASVSASDHMCGLTRSGSVYCWGPNAAGQLGNGQTVDAVSPVRVRLPAPASIVATGLSHTCAAGAATMWCWGRNDIGQLGQGSAGPDQCPAASCSLFPLNTMVPSSPESITAGDLANCTVSAGGLTACWGFGQSVGDGSVGTLRSPPDTLYGGHRFRQVSQGTDHACALTLSDTLLCWGQNQYGQTGQPAPSGSAVPTAVFSPLRFTSVSAGTSFTCGVGDAGDGYCWGSNAFFTLGDGSSSSTETPVPVAGNHTFSAISAGAIHACGLTRTGEIWCWGTSYTGALGPSANVAEVPVLIPFSQGFTSVSAGSNTSCGMATDERLYCWGYYAGAGGPVLQTSPVAVDYQR